MFPLNSFIQMNRGGEEELTWEAPDWLSTERAPYEAFHEDDRTRNQTFLRRTSLFWALTWDQLPPRHPPPITAPRTDVERQSVPGDTLSHTWKPESSYRLSWLAAQWAGGRGGGAPRDQLKKQKTKGVLKDTWELKDTNPQLGLNWDKLVSSIEPDWWHHTKKTHNVNVFGRFWTCSSSEAAQQFNETTN